jgi:hypothetical protein
MPSPYDMQEQDAQFAGDDLSVNDPMIPPAGANADSSVAAEDGDITSGMRPKTADFLNNLAGIGTGAYLAMRQADTPEYEDWRDGNFIADGSGNYVSGEGQAYTGDELEQMHGLLSRQAGNPLVSGLFAGPKSPLADYMTWRNQNYLNKNETGGAWEDEDGNLYTEPALQEMFGNKFARQSAMSGQESNGSAEGDDSVGQGTDLAAQAAPVGAGTAGLSKQRKPPQQMPLVAQQSDNPTFFFGDKQPDPSWTDIREYIAQEARSYGIPVKLAEAVAKHESNFDIHLKSPVYAGGKIVGYDRGIMQVNDTNTGWLGGPQEWRFRVDPERVKNDWKYNVHVGMAILRNAYAGARVNTVGDEDIARETYARYNAPRKWQQLYTVPGGKVSQHVDQFMKSWHFYYDNQ